jgi:hypothetical protein
LEIVEKLVKPERTRLDALGNYVLMKPLPQRWWQYCARRPALYQAITPLKRVMLHARVTKTHAFTFIQNDAIYSDAIVVITLDKNYHFSILNSSFHEYWAWKTSSTMKGDRRYTSTDSFEPFPFPLGLDPDNQNPSNPCITKLEALGERLDISRKEIMIRLNIGLTKLYNLYHAKDLSTKAAMSVLDCDEPNAAWSEENIVKLRGLQKEIDETVLTAYGWNELSLEHGFYELEFLPENDRTRYTVSNNVRREILQRLLALNHERHKEEVAAGLVGANGKPLKKKNKKGKMNNGFVNEPFSLFESTERGDLF